MNANILNTPPGFARIIGPKGRIFYKILCPIHPWLYNLHKGYLSTLGDISFKNQFECIKPHLRRRFMFKLDLANAFNSVTAIRANRYADIYFEENEEYFFHENGGLIQGALASPAIFNLYCTEVLDPELSYYCSKNNLLITRYVDDILISSFNPITLEIQENIYKIVKRSQFKCNIKKSRYVDNKFQSIGFVGIRILNHKARPTDSFLRKLKRTPHESESYRGLENWKNQVLALN